MGSKIHHYVHVEDGVPQLAREIDVGHEAALCIALNKALVFVVPGEGVFQVDRDMDATVEVLRLGAVPDHYSDATKFKWLDPDLRLVTGALYTEISYDTSVLNDEVPDLRPSREFELNASLDRPWRVDHELFQFQAGQRYFQFGLPQLIPLEPDKVRIERGRLKLGEHTEFAFEPGLVGHCPGNDETFVYDNAGLLRRLSIDQTGLTVHETGRFRLSASVTHCLADEALQRLYVTNNTSVLWVFDLTTAGLEPPRGVTSDRIVEAVAGLALYGSSYVITQSTGDFSFLVLSADNMEVIGQFRVEADVANGLDGVTRSLGFAAVAETLPEFPKGLLLIQDELNRLPDGAANLKLIDWRSIEQLLE